VHRFTAPAWLAAYSAASTHCGSKPGDLSRLEPGMAYLWAKEATEPLFEHGPCLVRIRPRLTRHGGHTVQATERGPKPDRSLWVGSAPR